MQKLFFCLQTTFSGIKDNFIRSLRLHTQTNRQTDTQRASLINKNIHFNHRFVVVVVAAHFGLQRSHFFSILKFKVLFFQLHISSRSSITAGSGCCELSSWKWIWISILFGDFEFCASEVVEPILELNIGCLCCALWIWPNKTKNFHLIQYLADANCPRTTFHPSINIINFCSGLKRWATEFLLWNKSLSDRISTLE